MTIQRTRKTSLLKIPQSRAKSAIERYFNANASIKNPNTTFTALSQLPDFGIAFIIAGNRAKSVNGIANASANPNIPIAGAIELLIDTSTNNVPIIGAMGQNSLLFFVLGGEFFHNYRVRLERRR